MSQLEKARIRLLSKPKDYTYSECRRYLGKIGFSEYNKGKPRAHASNFIEIQTIH